MRRLWVIVLVGAVVLGFVQPVQSMRKMSTVPGAPGRAVPPGMQLGKKQPGPTLTAGQQATIKRRIMTAMSGLDRVHVVGSVPAPVPPEALDALAEWRDHDAKDVEMWWDPDTRTPFFIKGNDLALPTPAPLAKLGHDLHTAAALGTFTRLPEFLGLRNAESELLQLSQQTDDLGMTHVRFQQTYRGHDVWARDLYCHFTPDSRMNLINGRWAPTPVQLDGINPVLNATAAIEAVRMHFADRTQIETSDTTLVVYIDSDQIPHWAWMVRTSLGPTEGYDVFIDAVTGGYLHQVSFVYSDGPIVGSGVDLFGQTRTVNAYQVGSWYYMINTTKPMFNLAKSVFPDDPAGAIQVWDKKGLTDPNWYYVRTANPNVWSEPATVSATRNFGLVYDYYYATHGRSSFSDSGSTLLALVNDPTYSCNAFWNGQMIKVCIPGVECLNWAGALDFMGHEFTHGVTQYTCNLIYENQSGALNESLSDIFGTLIEFYAEGTGSDWLIGEDIYTPGTPGDAYRDMQNPHNGKSWQPATMSEFLYKPNTQSGDWGGVHYNSGIPNRAFYLIATAIGRGKADSIYYRTLATGKLTRSSQFIDLRRGVIQSAAELYPGNPAITSAITSAFDAVEIYDGPPTSLPDEEPVPTSTQWIAAISGISGRILRFDTAGNFGAVVSSAGAVSKPSMSDSSKVVFFIDNTYSITIVGADGTGEAQFTLPGVFFKNIAVSPDGRRLAYDVFPDPTIYVLDLTDSTGTGNVAWPLYTPTDAESVTVSDVYFPDVLEWDVYSQRILYDCYNRLLRQSDTLWYWDILSLDFQTGVIHRIVPTIPPGTTIGNPTVAKTKPNIVAFDAELVPGTIWIVGVDLERNKLDVICWNGTSWGRPSFSPDDRRLVYHYDGDLWRVSLDSTSIHGMGNDQLLAFFADAPNWRFTGRDTPVGVFDTDDGPGIPSAFSLYQNYPNPFNASTVISYDARSVGPVALEIFNILGQRVFVRNQESVLPGRHTFTWNGADQSGESVPSGLYLYRVTAGGVQQTRKMVLLK